MIDFDGYKDFDPFGEETNKLIEIIFSIYKTNQEENSNEKEDTLKEEEKEIKEINEPDIQETKIITNKDIVNNEENQLIEEFNIINKVTKSEKEKKDNDIFKGTIKIQTNKKNADVQIKDIKEKEKTTIFKTSIRGRPKNCEIRPKQHTKYDEDNAAKVFITRCKKSIHESNVVDIQIFAKEEKIKTNTTINVKFYEPVIHDYIKEGIPKKLQLFDTPIKTIYENNNKDVLDKILSIEQENNDIQIKILNLKFSAKFLLYLEAFLNDEKSITINGIELELKEFETLSECFNEGAIIHNKESKDKTKKYLEEMIQKKLKIRKTKGK